MRIKECFIRCMILVYYISLILFLMSIPLIFILRSNNINVLSFTLLLLCISSRMAVSPFEGFRYFRSQQNFYKDLSIPDMSDKAFCDNPVFSKCSIPETDIISIRNEFADALDYPPLKLGPDMLLKDIPYRPESPFITIDDLNEEIRENGMATESFLDDNKTVGDLIIDLYRLRNST